MIGTGDIPRLAEFKEQAKKVRAKYGVKPTHAHEILARYYGFRNYNHYLSTQEGSKCHASNP